MTSPKLMRLIARATAGDAEALAALAQTYEEGKGVKKDPDAAMTYWCLAADKGHPRAIARLVAYHLDHAHRDEARAVAYARQGARTGKPEMMSLLGRMALKGEGMPQDLALAKEMLGRAAERYDLEAQVAYGQMLLEGVGCDRDVPAALAHLGYAARQENEPAMRLLARVYDEGTLTPRDPYLAYLYLGKSVSISEWHEHQAPFNRLLEVLTREQANEARRVIDMYHYEQGHTDWSGPIH